MSWSVASLLLVLLGCSGDKGGEVAIEGLVGILITPDPVVVPVGGSAQLSATGLLDSRESIDMTALVQWQSSSPEVARARSGLDREGELEGLSSGETMITARYDGITSPGAVARVTDAELLRLTVSPPDLTLATGEAVQLMAAAGFSDGSSGDVTGQVRWITSDGDVAQLSPGGRLSAVGEGAATVTVEWSSVESEPASVTVLPQSSGAPDLVISAMSGSVADGLVSLSATVENVGASSAVEFWVDAWGDPSGTPAIGDVGDDFVLLSYLGAGQSQALSFDLPGSSGVYVLADTNDDVAESDESNNSASGAVTSGGGGSGGPDLTVSYFDYIADEYSIYYYVEVFNAGDEAAGGFYVDVFVDEDSAPEIGDYGDEYELMDGLGAGERVSMDALVERWCGWCWSWVLVDSLDWVEEANEADNVAGPMDVYSK
jgi:hypothetical protein